MFYNVLDLNILNLSVPREKKSHGCCFTLLLIPRLFLSEKFILFIARKIGGYHLERKCIHFLLLGKYTKVLAKIFLMLRMRIWIHFVLLKETHLYVLFMFCTNWRCVYIKTYILFIWFHNVSHLCAFVVRLRVVCLMRLNICVCVCVLQVTMPIHWSNKWLIADKSFLGTSTTEQNSAEHADPGKHLANFHDKQNKSKFSSQDVVQVSFSH